jgi:hypothetical protein
MIRTLRAIVIPALLGLGLLALVGLAGSALILYREASAAHPVLGWTVLGLLALAAFLLLVLPVARLAALPRGLRRPDTEEGPAWDDYLRRYGKRLRSNRVLQEDYPGYGELKAAVDSGDRARLETEATRAVGFLDGRAREIVTRHAAAVFTTTAVSQSGRLDTMLVFSAQLRMVKEIAELYWQRPTLRDLLRLYGNVGTAAFVAGELEDSEILAVLGAPVTAGITGLIPVGGTDPLVSLLVNSLLDGSTNAFLTLRVGILAQRYAGLHVSSDRRGLARSASLEAGALLADVVGRGAKRIATITRKAVAKSAVRGPQKAVRGVTGIGAAVAGGIAGLAGRAGRGAATAGQRGLQEAVDFWEDIASLVTGETRPVE